MKLPKQPPSTAYALGFLVGMIAIIVATPFVFIWSINTLFVTDIPYTFVTWIAAFSLLALVNGVKIQRNT